MTIEQLHRPWFKKLAEYCKRKGNYIVVMDRDSSEPYLERFYLHPRWLTLGLFRVVIHRFWKSDSDEAFHDHPWLFWGSKLLEGSYTEHMPKGSYRRNPGKTRWYSGWALHQIQLDKRERDGQEKVVWTLFVMGPKIRDWGFMGKGTLGRWIKWDTYLESKLKASKVQKKKRG